MTSASFLVTFGDVSIKFEQTQYQNETFRSLVQRYVFASTLQLSSQEKNQFILRTCSIKSKFFLQQFGTYAESVVLLYVSLNSTSKRA